MLKDGMTYGQVGERLQEGVQNLVDVYGPPPAVEGDPLGETPWWPLWASSADPGQFWPKANGHRHPT